MTDTTSDAGSGNGFGRRGTREHNGREGKEGEEDEEDEVDEVVVENEDSPERWARVEPNSTSDGRGETGTSPGTGGVYGTRQSEGSSLRNTAFENTGPLSRVVNLVRWRIYPLVS